MQRLLGRITLGFFGEGALPDAPPANAAVPGPVPAPSPPPGLRLQLERWLPTAGLEVLGAERTQDVLVIGFCAAFSLIGWLMIVQGASELNRSREAERWPSVRGTIESVEVRAVAGREGAHWRPQVTYSYAVAGHAITATRLSLGKAPFVTDARAAQAYASRYRPRTAVTVYYNPAEVTESVLEVATPARVYLNLAFGMGLACLGPLLLLGLSLPAYRRARAAGASSPAASG